MSSSTHRSATATLPAIYRHMLLTIEPIFAILGARTALMDPAGYLKTLTGDNSSFQPHTTFLYTELAAAWLVFAFNEAVVLRMFDDLRLWKVMCWGMLLSDVLFYHSTAQALGGWAEWAQVARWRADDWSVFLSTVGPLLVRVLVVLEVGFKRETSAVKKG